MSLTPMPSVSHIQKGEQFVKIILDWASKNYRCFPWRVSRTPYRVFIAESLLRRTTSTAVSRVFEGVIKKYPDINSLVYADQHDLEDILRPTGLIKTRSSGLIEAANFIVSKYRGEFPKTVDELLTIPTVGTYTAACILSFGYEIPTSILDTNVGRVIDRVFFVDEQKKPTTKEMKTILEIILPPSDHVAFNYGLIDFGALICSYRGCKGTDCPLYRCCIFGSIKAVKTGNWGGCGQKPSIIK